MNAQMDTAAHIVLPNPWDAARDIIKTCVDNQTANRAKKENIAKDLQINIQLTVNQALNVPQNHPVFGSKHIVRVIQEQKVKSHTS